jgi:hypothetical protein
MISWIAHSTVWLFLAICRVYSVRKVELYSRIGIVLPLAALLRVCVFIGMVQRLETDGRYSVGQGAGSCADHMFISPTVFTGVRRLTVFWAILVESLSHHIRFKINFCIKNAVFWDVTQCDAYKSYTASPPRRRHYS